MALSDMRSELRNLVNEPVTALMTDTQANAWLNDGSRLVARKTECLEDRRSFSAVGYQQYYSHGTYFLRLKDLAFDSRYTVWPVDNRAWEMETRFNPTNLSSRPQIVRDWEDKYEVFPRVSADADTTTLDTTIDTGASYMTVADATGFDKMGRVLLESEVIGYNHLTGVTNAIIEGLQRGLEGTTDTSHASAVTITKRDFIEDFYCVPQTMATDAQVSSMPVDAFEAIYLWGQYKWHSKNKDPEKAGGFKNMFEQECHRLKSDLRKKQNRLNKTIKAGDRYIGRL
jgi:hypothetical protein